LVNQIQNHWYENQFGRESQAFYTSGNGLIRTQAGMRAKPVFEVMALTKKLFLRHPPDEFFNLIMQSFGKEVSTVWFEVVAQSFCGLRTTWLAIGILTLVTTTTLASYKSIKVKVNPARNYPFVASQGQVSIAADPYETNDKIKTAFDIKDMEKLGVVPVNVIITNESDDTILVSGQDINLLDEKNRSLESLNIEEVVHAVISKGKSPSTRGPAPPSRLPVPQREGSRGDAFEIDMDFNNKALKELKIAPKTTASGFVFFRLPDRQMRLAGHKLYIPQVKNLRSKEDLLFFEIEIK
jgi:hypothetical protein